MEKKFFAGRFEDKVMIVTGGARGIGKETAIRAAKEGAKVVVVDKLKEGTEVVKNIVDNGGDAIFLELDLSNEENCKSMVEQTVSKYGKLDIAVNNASIAGLTGLPGNPAYVASKHAVNGLTKNLALDYARFNIRVNSVNPAGTDTPMVEEAMEYVKAKMQEARDKGMDPAQSQSMAGQKTQTIQKRNATAEEQAASILFLASDDSTHMTGATLQTDGGWTSF